MTAALDAPSKLRRAAHVLLAPVLATMAVGVHFVVNVPAGGPQVSTKDQGAAKPAAKPKKPKKPKKRGFEARPVGEVEATWLKYENVEFEAEPVKSAWARPHQTLVNQAVAKARSAAFEGAPEEPKVSIDEVSCRSVRCQFILRGPYNHEVALLNDSLAGLQLDGATIWRHYSSKKVDPPKDDQPKTDTYLLVTIAFMEDNMDNAKFEAPVDEIGGGAEDSEGEPKPAAPDDEPDSSG